MIPAARVRAEEPPTRLTGVRERLQQLRTEQRASERPSFRSLTPTQTASGPRWLEGALRPAPTTTASSSSRYHGRRGTAGPAAPPSWNEDRISREPTLVDGRAQHGTWMQPLELVDRRKLAAPLQGPMEETGGVGSLFSFAGQVVAGDLALGADASLLLEHVAYLPNHLRLRLLDVFADVDNKAPLTSDGAVQLLRTDVSDGYERAPADTEDHSNAEEEEEDDWETGAIGGEGKSLFDLPSLDFSFSVVSLRTLRNILMHPAASNPADASALSRPSTPASPALPIPPAPKLLPTFPLLHTLNLTSTSRISFSDAFFDLLSHLISLRSLSLSGKTLSSPGSAVTASTFLPRLAASTPTLVELDLSYIDFAHVNVQSVDWDTRWLGLKVLGLRRELVDWRGEEVKPEKKERIKREVWAYISSGRQKKRRWIEIIV